MAGQRAKSARAVAADVLNRFDPARNRAGPILNELLHSTQARQRATDLVFGTIRNRNVIDIVITRFADCPVERIPARLLNIVRVGLYELVYRPETPVYSVVNEAVESAREAGGRKQTGFVNAVLRQIARHITNRCVELSRAEPRKTIPRTSAAGCEFDTNFLPHRGQAPADYLSTCFSLPRWLVADWLDQFGTEPGNQLCIASNRSPSVYVRPNTLKATAPDLAELFRRSGVEAETVSKEGADFGAGASMIRIKGPQSVTQLPGFSEGLFSVQDIAAAHAVWMLRPQPGWKILDLCAAPGVKTTQLAEAVDDSADIFATDVNAERLEKVRANVSRLGINRVQIIRYEDLEGTAAKCGPFDAVLLDVPCSNTGVLARRVEVRFRLTQGAIGELVKIQSGLLDRVGSMVKAGGKICYSTCSIQRCENADLVRDLLSRNPSFGLESERLVLPSAERPDHDGGYVAILKMR